MSKSTASRPNFHALVPAAGNGNRTGLAYAKQFHPINGKTILDYTTEALISHPNCKSITVILDANEINSDHLSIKKDKPLYKTQGGESRKESVYNGLKSLNHLNNNEVILIHDAARPFLKHEDIDALLDTVEPKTASTLYKDVSDTIVQDTKTIDRSALKSIQTPQGFFYGDIMQAHETFKADNSFTDDISLAANIGMTIQHVKSKHYNEKITMSDDIKIAEKLLAQTLTTKTGLGFDVHAFEAQSSGRPLVLCGIQIDEHKALKGHSDADVGLHAITDALLGAIAEGDIGRHFPPSDPKNKDLDSTIFLKHAKDLADQKGATINNIDLTLICETPKITPYSDAMITRVANILLLDKSCISIKATTSEKLGFTGRGEGIAAQAIATLSIPT